MPSVKEIKHQLENSKNWVFISNKDIIIDGLQSCLGKDEELLDIIEGLYNGKTLNNSGLGISGVLCATDRRLLFLSNESLGLHEEISFKEITSLNCIKEYSSLKINMTAGKNSISFNSFSSKASVELTISYCVKMRS